MAHYAYRRRHVERRNALLAYLAMHPGELKCAIGGETLTTGMALDLHHSNPEDKKKGLPGEQLACRTHNRGQRSVPPQVRARQQQETAPGKIPRTPDCPHLRDLDRDKQGCLCSAPIAHHLALATAAKSAGTAVTVNHYGPPCKYCGGYGGTGRIW
jgi:hypothetical protein